MLDVIIVGGGSAGLSAALVLGRARRHTLVLDGGQPRNTPAEGVHGFFTRDGTPPLELLEIGRAQLQPYATVRYQLAKAVKASGLDGAFEVTLADGQVLTSRKLLLATGVVDDLPGVPGLPELWGRGAYHCPYCHGWEVRDQPLAVYCRGEGALELAPLIRHWSRNLVLVSDGPLGLDEAGRIKLEALGIGIREEKIARLEGNAEGLERIVFENGDSLARSAIFVAAGQHQRSDLAEMLGCEITAFPGRTMVKNDEQKQTTVPGVYVIGDAGTPLQQVLMAASSGAAAAAFINRQLLLEDIEAELSVQTV